MTFIEEIEPYIERIHLHAKGGRITNINILREIRDIHFKYIRYKDFDTPSNLGCSNCVRQMINQLVGEIGRQTKHTVDLDKALPILNKTLDECWDKAKQSGFNNAYVEGQFEETKGKKMTFPKQEPIGDIVKVTESDKGIDIRIKPTEEFIRSCMKWGEFKKYCTSKGIGVKGKTRKQLEEELNSL